MMVILEPHVADKLWNAGLVALGFGVILDPQWYRMSYAAVPRLAAIPNVCRALFAVGCLVAAIGLVMGRLHIGSSR
jgi:hypothetical protein